MVMKKRLFFKITKRILKFFQNTSLGHIYKVVGIEETEKGDYVTTIQIRGKNITYRMKPEEILSDDKMTNQFSQHDIRTLTYLGYLGINSPKYRILAQRLAEDDQMLFLIQEKGKASIQVKTANDLSKDVDVLEKMSPRDTHLIGYTKGSEHILTEKKTLQIMNHYSSKEESIAST